MNQSPHPGDASNNGNAQRFEVRVAAPPRGHILIIDDCKLFRDNLAAALTRHGFPAPSVAWDLPSLVAALDTNDVQTVLVNTATRGSNLLLHALADRQPKPRIIALGISEDDEAEIVACAEVGVTGYHVRSDSTEDLIALMSGTSNDMTSYPPRIAAVLLRRLFTLADTSQEPDRKPALTGREIQILRMLELGQSNREIANQLGIALYTVKNHVHNLLAKLRVNSRAEAAELARNVQIERDHKGRR